ncbi:hypothetical protein SLEP1_g55863 [Rubroshorea leprosula]|uniref:CCHC-type domain-containing protein n=1 Tax=Rubroshorea leprosula TaxID=152421 RepID=A0AAV5MHV3_9ROSI|nr:hypothetical protein SLEP1_g55863 [Rubroshorea leprosula]
MAHSRRNSPRISAICSPARVDHHTGASSKSSEVLRDKLHAEIQGIIGTKSIPATKSTSVMVSASSPVADTSPAVNPVAPTRISWADVVTSDMGEVCFTNVMGKASLSYFPPEMVDGKPVVKPPSSVYQEGIKSRENCLIGSFLGSSSPNYGDIVYTVNHLWGKKGKILVTGMGNGTFLFQIPDSATRDWVLNSKIPWHVRHKILILRKWDPNAVLSKAKPAKMPIWATKQRTRVNFAQICVEVDVEKIHTLPESAPVNLDGNLQEEVSFEYPWLPVKCETCKKEGHTSRDCAKESQSMVVQKQEWRTISKGKKKEQAIVEEDKGPAQEKDIQIVQAVEPTVLSKSPSLPLVNSFDVLEKSFELAQVSEQPQADAAPILEPRKVRTASQGVAIAIKALVPKQRQPRKSSNSSGERSLKSYLSQYNADIVCLLETHVQQKNFIMVSDSLLPGWTALNNYEHAKLGRIWVFHRPHIHMSISSMHHQAIHCHVFNSTTAQYLFLSVIYADPYSIDLRQDLWGELVAISQALLNVPWLVGRDFNEIRDLCERSDWQSISCLPKEAERNLDPIAKKLDRLMVNEFWFDVFPNTTAEFLPPGCSDHCARLVDIKIPEETRDRKPFKFFNFWAKHENFLTLVKQSWETNSVHGCYMFQLCKKLKALKLVLRKLNREHYYDLQNRLQQEKSKLHIIQADLLASPHDALVSIEHEQAQKVAALQLAEESYFKQKSRIQWLKEGDGNTTYFHKVVKARTCKNTIRELYTLDNKKLTSPSDMQKEAVGFYKGLLGTADRNCSQIETDCLKSLLQYQLPDDMKSSLTQPITAKEIKDVVFNSPTNKAPGPDGFTSEFYKAAWPVVGDLVIKAIKEFFTSGMVLAPDVHSKLIL